MLDEIRPRCACRGAIRSPEVAKQRAATRSQEAAREEIYAVARAHKAEKLWVFGSCARKEETPDSDVDFLVKFGDDAEFGAQVRLGDDLKSYFNRKVDIVSERGLSPYVADEAEVGDSERALMRKQSMAGCASLDGTDDETIALAEALITGHAVPVTETTDAFHIATTAVGGMDVLLTWNCKHMANPVTLPKTAAIITKAG